MSLGVASVAERLAARSTLERLHVQTNLSLPGRDTLLNYFNNVQAPQKR